MPPLYRDINVTYTLKIVHTYLNFIYPPRTSTYFRYPARTLTRLSINNERQTIVGPPHMDLTVIHMSVMTPLKILEGSG